MKCTSDADAGSICYFGCSSGYYVTSGYYGTYRTHSRLCTNGQFDGTEIVCAPCLAGTFKTSPDPAAEYAKNKKLSAKSCDNCPTNTGTGSITGANLESSCQAAAGYFGSGSNVEVCAANTYKATADHSKACDDCPTNTGTGAVTGSIAESECLAAAGYFGSGSNVDVCAANTYKATATSAKACDDCPTNSNTGGNSGAKAESECLAAAGYFGSGSSIAACPADTFKTATGAAGCTGCPAKSNTGGATGSSVARACVTAPTSAAASSSAAATNDGNATASTATIIITVIMAAFMCCAIVVVAIVYKKEDKKKDRVAPTSQAGREALKNAFDLFDTDNTGELDKEEFRLAMSAGDEDSAFSNADFEKLFARVDSDGTGVISFDEYYRWSVE
jgi:hypothetical protein